MADAVRKIIYLSGTRADFGLMQATLQRVAAVADLSVAVTGMHLDTDFGDTLDEIRRSSLRICGEIPTDIGDRTPEGMSDSIGQCILGMTKLLQKEKPDILLLLGDRGEMLAGAIAALHLGIVSVHIHGGERSGTVDEPIRHAISKLSHYHFVATEESRERLIRMGELPARIEVTGAPGLDGIVELADVSRADCVAALKLPSDSNFVLTLFHPVVQQANDAYDQTRAILLALQRAGLPVLWLEPNADAGSGGIHKALEEVVLPDGSSQLQHMPRQLFCAAMKHCAVMVGNSSAGIIEAASFGTPVVNVGDRQRSRERNINVRDVGPDADAIHAAIGQSMLHGKWPCNNRFGDGCAGRRISDSLMALSLDRSILEKTNTY
ncbi:MAG: UDP-N-acetylglucosamine 2-epimerase [Pseudomonadota bacterium]